MSALVLLCSLEVNGEKLLEIKGIRIVEKENFICLSCKTVLTFPDYLNDLHRMLQRSGKQFYDVIFRIIQLPHVCQVVQFNVAPGLDNRSLLEDPR